METKTNTKASLSGYLSILLKWKKLFLITMIVVGILSVGYALLLPNKYRATTTFMIPSSQDLGLGGLGSLLSGESSALDIGTRLLGVTNTNEDVMMGFMKSRPAIVKLAQKYKLYEYYELENRYYEDLSDALMEDLQIEPNEYGFIEVSVINKDSITAANIANDFVKIADSLNIFYNITKAKNYKDFVEKRYYQTLSDLKKAEEAYYKFQKEFGAFDIPEQIKALVESTSILEGQVMQGEILLASIEKEFGKGSPQYIQQKIRMAELKNQLDNLYGGKSKDDFFLSINDIPDLQIEYLRKYRELEIQNQTLKYIYPIVEQARIDEKKNMPTIIVINKAFVPQKKYSPKRMFIVLGFGFFAFWIVVGFIFRGEKILSLDSRNNHVEEMEYKLFKSVVNKFKMRM